MKIIDILLFAAAVSMIFSGCMSEPFPLKYNNPADPENPQFDPPDPPSDLQAEVGTNNILLSWSGPDTGVSGYHIYLSSAGSDMLLLDSVEGTTYLAENLEAGTNCRTAVSSFNSLNVESLFYVPIQGQTAIPGFYSLLVNSGLDTTSTPTVSIEMLGPEEMEFLKIGMDDDLDMLPWIGFEEVTEYAIPCSTAGFYSIYSQFRDQSGFVTGVLSDSVYCQ